MGIDIHFYTVYGIRIDGYNQSLADAWNDVYYEFKHGMINDSMGSEYMIAGAILAKSENLRDGLDKMLEIIDLSILDKRKEEYTAEFKKFMPEHALILKQDWQLMSFVHYS